MVLGDFNAISGQHKKWGGRPVSSSSSDGFLYFKTSMGLVDVGSSGPCFTWCNGRHGNQKIRERLDKGLANGEWISLFPCAVVKTLPRVASDHAPIFLDTNGASNAGPKPFRFESCWVKDEASKKVVQ